MFVDMKKIVCTLFALFLSLVSVNSQSLVVNEVVTKNNYSLSDKVFKNADWFELYNGSNQSINLKGYYLSDDSSNKLKWQFKNGVIAKDSHIVVFASGTSKDSLIGLKATKEDIGSIGWAYSDSQDETSPGTSTVSFTKFSKSVFGKVNNKNIVAAKIYLGLPGQLGYSYAGVHVKFEDWDREVNRSEFDVLRLKLYLEKGKKAKINFGQTGVNEWENFSYIITGRGDTSWYDIPIQKNTGLLDLSKLTGLGIIAPDSPFDVSFEFILFNIEWSKGENERFSTDFKLSSSGDVLYLSNPQGVLIDEITIPALEPDYSYGRKTDGAVEWVYFQNTTPEKSNGGKTIIGFCGKTINFNKTSGFYNSTQTIELSGASSIKYTLDGSNPTLNSLDYSTPITINKSVVVRAGCFDDQKVPKEIFTNTYFVGYNTKLPVWSISTDPANFFDEETGIYVKGKEGTYEEASPYFGANFWQDWERPIHIEFFEQDGSEAFELDAGVKVFGNYSRANPKKSLSIHFRSEYGSSKLEYPLYPNYPGINSFDDILLRGSGGDEAYLHFRDGFHSVLAKDLEFEKQKYRPSVLFINGEYWGIHNIREKSNEDYFKENYNIDKSDIDLITSYFVEKNGSTAQSFEDFIEEIKVAPKTLNQISSVIDLESFIDYNIFEIYIANYDWPANNSKYWRQSSVNGKWRWFLYDTDFSTGIYGDKNTQFDYDNLKHATSFTPNAFWPNSENSTILLKRLLAIPEFKVMFINRYCDLINTKFVPQNVYALMQTEVIDKIQEEIAPNRTRWNLDVDAWQSYVDEYKLFWEKRPPFARSHMKNNLTLDQEVTLNLQILPEGSGYIKLNTIQIDNPSWSGIYFKGIPVNIEAVPNPGYQFVDWNSSAIALANANNAKISNLDLVETNTFVANFSGNSIEQLITISEINYHSPNDFNTQDWLEIHNYGSSSVDLSNWKIKDAKLYNKYIIPQGTIIEAGKSLVIAENLNAFKTIHPTISVLGPLGFSLDNSGDYVYLLSNRGKLIQSIHYSDDYPWATYADGMGGSLELVQGGLDVTEASNWKSICFGGSPNLMFDETCPQKFTYLDDLQKENLFSIVPNPASSIVQIIGDIDIEKIEFFDLNGIKVFETENVSGINISLLNIGLYFVKVSNQKGYYFQKLVVQR
jgi:hypothetical protein